MIVTQAYRYNNYLGEVVLGVLPKMHLTIADVKDLLAASKASTTRAWRSRCWPSWPRSRLPSTPAGRATALNQLKAFITEVKAQSGKHISRNAAAMP